MACLGCFDLFERGKHRQGVLLACACSLLRDFSYYSIGGWFCVPEGAARQDTSSKTPLSLQFWGKPAQIEHRISTLSGEVSAALPHGPLHLGEHISQSPKRMSTGRVFRRADVAGGHLNRLPCPWPCWEPEGNIEIAACHRTVVFNLCQNCPLKSSTQDFPDKAITAERTKGK